MKKVLSCMMGILLLASILASAFNIESAECSEPPETEWTRTYGGTGEDVPLSVVQTDDGGYALAGRTKSFGAGGYDFWLVKTDGEGNMQWNETYGSEGTESAEGGAIQTPDGGYLLIGHKGDEPNRDMWVVKTDASGNHEWNETYDGWNDDTGRGAVLTDDGGYALVGNTRSSGEGDYDFWLIRINSTGGVQWDHTYGGANRDLAACLVQADDGGYALAGKTRSFGAGYSDGYLVKTNSTGHMQWHEPYGTSDYESFTAIVQTSDGGYALAGQKGILSPTEDFWLVKTTGTGDEEWSATYDLSQEHASSMARTELNKGYALVGGTESFGAGNQDFWFIKTDASGNHEWNQTYGDSNDDWATSVVQTADGGYAIAGYTESFGEGDRDFWLIKLAPEKTPATVDIDPDTLNLKSNGQWITAYIELPEGHCASEIDVSSILLNGSISVDPEAPTAIGDHDADSIPDLMVKFERAVVTALLGTHDYGEDTGKSVDVALVISGEAAGTPFEGVDTVRVLLKS